jgi:hypothetical protein
MGNLLSKTDRKNQTVQYRRVYLRPNRSADASHPGGEYHGELRSVTPTCYLDHRPGC